MRSVIIIDKKPIDHRRLELQFEAHQLVSPAASLLEDRGDHHQVPFIRTRISQTGFAFIYMNICDTQVFPSAMNAQAEAQLAVCLLKELPLGEGEIAATSGLSHKTEEAPPGTGF